MTNKITPPITKLLWLDLEMTGLDPSQDVIVEVAMQVSDLDFNIIDSYQARIKHDRDYLEKLFNANEFYSKEQTSNRDDFLNNLDKAKSLNEVELELIDFVAKNFNRVRPILAGNSIHFDRTFIKKYWPSLDSKLHYRMLDVTSWKIIMENKFAIKYKKQSLHLANNDIQESIDELKFYLSWLNVGDNQVLEEE